MSFANLHDTRPALLRDVERLGFSTHRLYDELSPIWSKMRDAVAGEDVVKARGETYLPRLTGQDEEAYRGYVLRAMFFGATGRTLQGLLGAVMRKDPVLIMPAAAEPLLANVTRSGEDFATFTRLVVAEQLTTGRCGVLVDVGQRGGLPYLRLYPAESILNWHEVLIDGVPLLDFVALAETVEPSPLDPEASQVKARVCVLQLDESGLYVQRLIGEDDGEIVILPTRLGRRLDFLPFQFVGAADNAPRPDKPPLLDLANVNLSHYRSSADLEHGRHFTALPTPYIVGADPDEDLHDPLMIGSGSAWMLPAGSHPGLLEFNGQGLKHLENALVEKQELMVQLGARMLETQKRSAETAEALRLRQAGDSATLSIVADTASRGLQRALGWLVDWAGIPGAGGVRVKLNADFFDTRMGPMELQSLVAAWQQGAIAFTDLHSNLVRGEVIDPDRTRDDVLKEIKADAQVPAA